MSKHEELHKHCWEKAKPNDRFVFVELLLNEDICIGVLETFLQIKIDHIVYLKAEENIEENFQSKGIRVDVYVKDDMGTVYNVEMQRRRVKNLPKRSRYYGSLMDLNCLDKGQDYQKLRKSFVIFICNQDPFQEKRCVYRFEYRDSADYELKLNDGTTKLFFYTRGKNKHLLDPRLQKLLYFFDNNIPKKIVDDPLLQRMTDEYYRIKANKEMEVDYMTQAVFINDWKNEGYEDAEIEFRSIIKKTRKELAKKDTQLAKNKAKLAEKDTQLAENKAKLAEKDTKLAEKDTKLAEKDNTIAKNQAKLAEKDNTIAERDAEIARLKAMLK